MAPKEYFDLSIYKITMTCLANKPRTDDVSLQYRKRFFKLRFAGLGFASPDNVWKVTFCS